MSVILSKKRLFPLYAAALTALLYLLILLFSNILGYGNLTILCGDLFSQYTAFIQLFLDVLKGNGNFWYSFSLYLGSPTAAVYAYYCLSPFNLLYLIPGISVSAMTIVLICLKLSLAAASFQHFAKKGLNVDHLFSLLLSAAYALCTFAVTMQIHIMWLDALYILPLLALCLIYASRDGRFLSLPILYAYLFITNFYMGYIVGVFSAFLYLALMIYFTTDTTKTSIVSIVKKSILYTGSVLLGAGCCAIVLLPCAVNLLSTRSEGGSSFQMVSATVLDVVNNLFAGEMQGMGSPFPLIYCGLPVLLLLPLYFMSDKITKKEKILVILILFFYLCGSLFLPIYQFLHAFEAPNWYGHRYAFCIVFLLLALCCRILPLITSNPTKKHSMIWLTVLLLFYAIMIPFQTLRFGSSYAVNSHEWWMINAAFLTIYTILFYMQLDTAKQKWTAGLFALLFCVELTLNGCYCISHNNFGFFSEEYINNWISGEKSNIASLQSTDPGFYRIRVLNEDSFNSPSYFHYPGLNTFSTTDAPKLRSTLSALGIGTSYMTIYDHGHTELTDRLFAVKYTIDNEHHEVLASKDTLPIAFMVSSNLAAWRPLDDVFQNQENAINLMCEGDYHFYTPIPLSEIAIEKKNMEILPFDTGYAFQHESDIAANGIITFRFPGHEGETILGYFKTLREPAINKTTPEAVSSVSGFQKAFNLSDGAIITSTLDSETNIPEIKVSFNSGANYDYFVENITFCSYSSADLSAACNDLKQQQCELLSWKDGNIIFKINSTEDRPILFTSIPYDDGWQAYVDDVPARIGVSLDGSFLAMVRGTGEHTVKLVYEQPYLFPASCISAVSVSVFLLLFLHQYKQNRRKENENGQKEGV